MQPLPKGAADCHMHVIGPFASYPLVAERAYNVEEAPLEAHEAMKRTVGLDRTVFVQASGHGTDNRAMLAALAQLGERARGVVVLEPGTPAAKLERLYAAGVRGLRLNLVTLASRHAGDPSEHVRAYEAILSPLGWHLQVFADSATLAALEVVLGRCKVNVVVDHMGLPDAALGLEQPGFKALLRLLDNNHVWVKLAGADRITRSSNRIRDAIPFMQALAAKAPQRLVWGSDWPHIGFHNRQPIEDKATILPYRKLDPRELLEVLEEAVPDRKMRDAILAGNPARLYDWP